MLAGSGRPPEPQALPVNGAGKLKPGACRKVRPPFLKNETGTVGFDPGNADQSTDNARRLA